MNLASVQRLLDETQKSGEAFFCAFWCVQDSKASLAGKVTGPQPHLADHLQQTPRRLVRFFRLAAESADPVIIQDRIALGQGCPWSVVLEPEKTKPPADPNPLSVENEATNQNATDVWWFALDWVVLQVADTSGATGFLVSLTGPSGSVTSNRTGATFQYLREFQKWLRNQPHENGQDHQQAANERNEDDSSGNPAKQPTVQPAYQQNDKAEATRFRTAANRVGDVDNEKISDPLNGLEQLDAPEQLDETEEGLRREQILASLMGAPGYIDFAYAAVNELAQYAGCDRVALIDCARSRYQLIAISGQPEFNKRSNLVRRMVKLAEVVGKSRRTCWSVGESLAPQLEEPFDRYMDESRSRTVGLYPLQFKPSPRNPTDPQRLSQLVNGRPSGEPPIQAVLLVESMEEALVPETVNQKLEHFLQPLAASASVRKRIHDLPLMNVWTRLAWFLEFFRGKTQKKAFAITGAVMGGIALAMLVPSDFQIRCEGEIQAADIRPIFGKRASQITKVLVKDGQQVKKGDLLVELDVSELKIRHAEAKAEFTNASQEHDSLRRETSDIRRQREMSDQEKLELRTKRLEASVRRDSAWEILEELDAELQRTSKITAPIDGQVYAWNAEQRLIGRPIQPGDRLFSIAQSDSPFVLKLQIADQRLGYVANAFRDSKRGDEPLVVRYVAVSDPGRMRLAHVSKIALSVDSGNQAGAVLPVDAKPIDTASEMKATGLRPGTAVIARVHCGRASFAYCKLYEFFDWFRRGWFRYVR